jgi:hypothetical protein
VDGGNTRAPRRGAQPKGNNAKLRGRVQETWLRGERIFSGGEFKGEPRGRELVRK